MNTHRELLRLKLSAPRTVNTIPRRALEDLLRKASDRKIVILCAPAGSGKSTFVVDFLKAHHTPVMWYNLDFKDSDPANFFETFWQGIRGFVKKGTCPPPFSTEYLQSIKKFSRSYFSTLFSGLRPGVAIVLDNYQNIPEDSVVHHAVIECMKELTRKNRLFVISRKPLPISILNWELESSILRLDWGHIRFTDEEVQELIELNKPSGLTDSEVSDIVSTSHGWVSGVLLSLRRKKRYPNGESRTFLRFSLDVVNIDRADMELLILVAELPYITPALARAVTSSERIIEILERLSSQGFFVVPVSKVGKAFKLHDLFRQYLQAEAKKFLSPEHYRKHLYRVGKILNNWGYPEEAIRIFHKIGAMEEVLRILREKSLEWLHTGKVYTIERCVELFEGTSLSEEPCILYLRAALAKFHKPLYALKLLRQALSRLGASGDVLAKKAVIAEILDTAQYYGEDFSITEGLLEKASELMDVLPAGAPTVVDAMLPAYAGIVYLLHRGDCNRSVECFKKASFFMMKIGGMELFLSYMKLYTAIAYWLRGLCLEAEESFQHAMKIVQECPEYPAHRFMFHTLSAAYEVFSGRFAKACERVEQTLKYVCTQGLHLHEKHLRLKKVEALLGMGLKDEAREQLNKVFAISHRASFSESEAFQLQAQLYLMDDNPYLAIQSARRAIELCEKIKACPFKEVARGLLAVAYAELGEYERAKKILKEIVVWGNRTENTLQVFTSLMHLAWVAYRETNRGELTYYLKEALTLGSARGFYSIYNWYPRMLSVLLSIALEEKIETEYVKTLIRLHKLEPPQVTSSPDSWIWRLKIFSFGELQVILDGKVLTVREYRGSKVLNLLKALITLGGTNVQVVKLVDLLWPDADGDRGMQNFEFTLRRLRRVLTLSDTEEPLITLKSGTLSINPSLGWLDIWAFNTHVELFEKHFQEKNYHRMVWHAEKAIEIYRKEFLADHDEPWVIERRHYWHQKYKRCVELLLDHFREGEQWQRIISLCRKAMEVDPMSENLAYHLMHALYSSGDRASAVKVYMEFSNLLQKTLNIAPSKRLKNLYLAISRNI